MGETSQVVTGLLADTGSLALGTQGSFPGICVMHECMVSSVPLSISTMQDLGVFVVPATVLRLVTACVFSS